MTIIIKEIVASRTFSSSGAFTASRTFVGYDDEEDIVADPFDILQAPGIPSYGQSHPDASGIFAQEYTLTPSAEGFGVWTVVWTYKIFEAGGGGDPVTDPDASGLFTRLDVDVGVTIIDLWRDVSNLNFLSIPGGINYPEKQTIIPVTHALQAEGREAVSLALPTATVSISHDIEAETVNMGPAQEYVGKRNDANWEGFEKGSVVFSGVALNRTAPKKYKITYKLSWDKWYHLRQIPERDSNGQVVVDKSDPANPNINIYWRQPHPLTADFGFIPEV